MLELYETKKNFQDVQFILLIQNLIQEKLLCKRKSKSLIITEKEIIDFAVKYDPQWFHSDPEASKESSFKGLIASGIHVAAIWRLLDHDANGDIKFVCGIGWENVRWQNPLRPGDEVYVWSKCLSKSDSSSNERGVVIFDHGLKRKN